MTSKKPSHSIVYVGQATRFWAFQIDLILLTIFVISPGVVFIENRFIPEGIFDAIGFALLILYFWGSNRFFAGTLGQRLMGYKVIPANGKAPRYAARLMYGFIAQAFWLRTIFNGKPTEDGIYWWDVKSNTRAVSTRHPN